MQRFPQLGSVADAPLELVIEELQARSRCRRLPDSAELRQRFPDRLTELQPTLDRLRHRAVERGSSSTNEFTARAESFATLLQQIGDYQISEQIGRGGFAMVYCGGGSAAAARGCEQSAANGIDRVPEFASSVAA